MKPVPEVIECSVVGPNSVRLRFRDGWSGTLDLRPALHGPIFGDLQQPKQFRRVTIQDGTLVWSNGADICPSVLRYWCEIGRVCSQAELDAHFEAIHTAPLTAGKIAEAKGKYTTKRRK
jgi:hypothetical protein